MIISEFSMHKNALILTLIFNTPLSDGLSYNPNLLSNSSKLGLGNSLARISTE